MKTFLLGVGCQKGGTTWLYDYLSGHPACDFGFRKEYHVFDALWIKGAKTGKFYRYALENLAELSENAAKKAVKGNRPPKSKKLRNAITYASFFDSPKNYAAYFDRLYGSDPNIRLVGDITPSYSGLTAEHFLKVRSLLENRGFNVKVIFLMRDPVERIYSATRMRIRDQAGKPEKEGKDPLEFFNRRYAWKDVEMRTRYERTMAALDVAFDPADVHYAFYETLFSEIEVRKITGFLGIDFVDPDFGQQVNASPRTAELDDSSVAKVRAYYDETYTDTFERFGERHIKSIWPHAGALTDEAPVTTQRTAQVMTDSKPDTGAVRSGAPQTIVAHLGAHKTATSLVQNYIKAKHGHYEKQGVACLTRSQVSPFISWGDQIIQEGGKFNKYLHRAGKKSGCTHVVFSNENALGRPFRGKSGLYPDHAKIIDALPAAFEGFTPKIVYSVRPPWEFLESYYLQMVHQGYFMTFNQYIDDLDLTKLSWNPLIEKLRSAFGRENVVVMDFSLIRKGQDVFLREFFSRTIGDHINVDTDYSEVHNASISDRGLQMALRVNPLLRKGETGAVRRFLQQNFSNLTEPRPVLLSEAGRRELKERYAAEYEELVAV